MLGEGREGGAGASEVWVQNGLDPVRLPDVASNVNLPGPHTLYPRSPPTCLPILRPSKRQVGSRVFGCHASCKGEWSCMTPPSPSG